MCQGLRDAANLAWKLKHVISNRAHENILKTYTQERRPNVLATTKLAKECGLIISERDLRKAKERDEKMFAENNGKTKFILRQNLIPPFESGLINLNTPLAGSVFPQPLVNTFNQSNILMDDITKPCFKLVLLEEKINENELPKIIHLSISSNIEVILLKLDGTRATERDPPLLEVTETLHILRNCLQAAGCIGAIVRPDHYVYSGIVSILEIAASVYELSNRLLE
jgi:3-(3-hydroxy-phenyl)propionate hydroxylase